MAQRETYKATNTSTGERDTYYLWRADDGTVVRSEWSGGPDPETSPDLTHRVRVGTDPKIVATGESAGKVLKFDGTHWVAQNGSATLPAGSDGDVLYHDGANWTSEALSGLAILEGQAAGGDLSGTYPNPSVVQLSIPATMGDILIYGPSGGWTAQNGESFWIGEGQAADGDLSGTYPNPTVTDNTSVQQVNVEHNGTLVGTRNSLNFIGGTNVTLTVADDATNDEVDITIDASGGSGGSVSVENNGTLVGTRPTLNFIESSGISLTLSDDATNDEVDITISADMTASEVSTVDQFSNSNSNNVQDVLDDLDAAINGNLSYIRFEQNGSYAGLADYINFVDGTNTTVNLTDQGNTMDVQINASSVSASDVIAVDEFTHSDSITVQNVLDDLDAAISQRLDGVEVRDSGIAAGFDFDALNFIPSSDVNITVTDAGSGVCNVTVEADTLYYKLAGGDLGGTYPNPVVDDLSLRANTGDMLYCSDGDNRTWARLQNPGNPGGDPWILNHDGTNPQWVHISTVQ